MIQLPNPPYQKSIPVFLKFPEIQAVYLFGSVATGRENPESDVDFGFMAVRNIKDELSTELIKIGFGNFSLVYIPEATPVLQFEIVKLNRLIYARNDFDRGSFFSKIVRYYMDIDYYYAIQRDFYKERFLSGHK
jgi:hypothetical protein